MYCNAVTSAWLIIIMCLSFLKGRNGKGAIFVVASGNGGFNNDSCAANGYASSIYTIAVGSADQSSQEASFDEECAAKMVVTPSFNSTAFNHGNLHNQVVSFNFCGL